MKSLHKCPVCGQPLSVKKPADFVILYCGNGPCPSKVANDGAIAGTEERAFDELKRQVEAEELESRA